MTRLDTALRGITRLGLDTAPVVYEGRALFTRMGCVNCHQMDSIAAEQNRKVLTPERVASILTHTPMNRFGEASELVGATVYLASRKAAFVKLFRMGLTVSWSIPRCRVSRALPANSCRIPRWQGKWESAPSLRALEW